MDIIILIAIIFLSLVAFTGLLSAAFRNAWVIGWEASFPAGIVALIIGAIIGAVLGIFSVVNLGIAGIAGILVLSLVIGASLGLATFVLIFTYNVYPDWARQILSGILIFAAVGGAIIGVVSLVSLVTSTQGSVLDYLSFASPITSGIESAGKEIYKFKYCFVADARCPFFVNWENPTVQNAQEQFYTKIQFSENKITSEDYTDTICSLSVMNPSFNDLTFKPECYYGDKEETKKPLELTKMGSYAYGDKFILQPSTEEQHTSFRCSGYISEAIGKNIYSTKIYAYLVRPVSVQTSWPVYIGEGSNMGQQRSTMNFNAPYSVALTSYNDMPFNIKKKYDFNIVIKNQDERNSQFVSLERLTLNVPEDYLINCEGMPIVAESTIEISDKNSSELKEIYFYSEDEDKYTIPCNLFVNDAPVDSTLLSPISVEALYTVVSKFQGTIIKKP